MKTLRQFSAAAILALSLALSVHADTCENDGHMPCPGVIQHLPLDLEEGSSEPSSILGITVSIVESVLSLP